jgi:hypothetical protein
MSPRPLKAEDEGTLEKQKRTTLPAVIFQKSKKQTKKLNSLAYAVYLTERCKYKNIPREKEFIAIVRKFVSKCKDKNIQVSVEEANQFFKDNLKDLEFSFQRMVRKQKMG